MFIDMENGEREDRDKEDREQHESAGDILQEEKWSAQESLRIVCALRC